MTTPPFSIRLATLADLAALQAIEKLFPSDKLSPRQMRHHITNPRALFLVAAAKNTPVAYALYFRREGRAARFYSLITHPDYRGLGIARALIEQGCRRLARAGERTVMLEVRKRDRDTIAFYERCGFVAGRTLPAYYEDGHEGLKMTKDLKR